MSDTQCRCNRSDRADVLCAVKRCTTMWRGDDFSGADVVARPLRSLYQITRAADSVRIALYAVFVIAYGKRALPANMDALRRLYHPICDTSERNTM